MSVIRDVLEELYKMFVADARLTVCVLVLVALVALGQSYVPQLGDYAMGFFLFGGCLGLVVMATTLHARKARKGRS